MMPRFSTDQTQRSFMRWPLLILCLTGVLCTTCPAQTAERPNVILCMGDDHGWAETGYNGHPHVHTPVLDEMAAAGLRLDNFYSASPVCSPTRGSVITGRHPNRYGTFAPNWSIRPEEVSIAQLLSDAGYACGHFGKWHLGPVKAESPVNPGAMGFDEWVSHDNFFEMNPMLSRNGGPPQRFDGESSQVLIDEATRFIRKAQSRQQPFFVVVWFGSPHEPYMGTFEDLLLYKDLPATYATRFVTVTSLETGKGVKRPLEGVLSHRYAEITAMDRAIGNLRTFLTEQGVRDNTLLWYCGDNGIPASADRVGSALRGQKGQVYEGGIRVPCVIEWPAHITAPRVSAVNAVTSDMLPTICDILDLRVPARPLDGVTLKPLLEGNMTARPEPICFWEFNAGREARQDYPPYIAPELQEGTTPLVKQMAGKYTRDFRNVHHPEIRAEDYDGDRAILDHRYKLVLRGDATEPSTRELFDIREDPLEKNNVIDAHPDVARALERDLCKWQGSVLQSLMEVDYE